MDTINAEEAHLEIESIQSEHTEAADDTQAAIIPRTPPAQTKPAETPEALLERPGGPIADILPTDLERLKESIPLFASDLAKSAGKLFSDDQEGSKSTGTPIRDKLKSPPAAFIPTGLPTHPRPDKFARSPYFNSWKGPSTRDDRELAEELFGEDAKPPAVTSKSLQGIQADIAEHTNASRSKGSQPMGNVFEIEGNPENKHDNVLHKLNHSIAQKQAQLEQLQASILSLKQQAAQSEVQITQDEIMQDVDQLDPLSLQPVTHPVLFESQGGNADNQDDEHFILVQNKNLSVRKNPPPPAPITQGTSVQASVAQYNPLTELAQKRPVYQKFPDPVPRRPFFQRTTWRIDIPSKTDSPQQGLIEALTEIWSILKKADDKMIIYPWRLRNHGQYKALSGPSKLPTTKEGINRYFADAYFRPHPGNMYVRAFIGTSISEAELGIRTQYFFGAKNNRSRVATWKNHLQFEDTVEIGWLFRSTPGMSPETIQKELFAHTGIHAAVRWRLISVVEFRGELPKNFQVKALHISVRRDDGNLAKAKFTKLVFAKHRRSHFIGGSPMRMIPISKDLSSRNQAKGIYYCSRQQTFLKEIVVKEVFEILQIDNQAIGLQGRTLRDLILEIPLKSAPNR
jgi:hypothetical protein